ncbi:MAG: cupredoxin domain-containing protein [Actinomycetota bacterium]|nr:cupredoxin domain-containing protein [Actinomycetota bacterium]
MVRRSVSLLVLIVLASACSSSNTPSATNTTPAATQSSSAAPACSPNGTTVQVTAKNVAFDKSCLAAPANTAFTVTFDNEDAGTPHNLAILNNGAAVAGDRFDPFNGVATKNFNFAALAAGTYTFHCEVHANMTGTFVVV